MDPTTGRLGREFADPALEAEFRRHRALAVARRGKRTAVLLSVAWIAYGVVDALTLAGRDLAIALLLRVGSALPLLLVPLLDLATPERFRRAALAAHAWYLVGCVTFIVLHPHPWTDQQAPAWVALVLLVDAFLDLHPFRDLVALNVGFAVAALAAWIHRVHGLDARGVAATFVVGASLLVSLAAARTINGYTRTMYAQFRQVGALQDHRAVLLSAVAHELRTPLARFRMALGLHELRPEASLLAEAGRQLDELDLLVTELVRWGQIPPGTLLAREDAVDVAAASEDAAAHLDAGRHGIEVRVEVPHDAVLVHGALFRSALFNVVANATRHATRTVRVSTASDETTVRVVVEDDGPGVPSARRLAIFEPFTQLDPARARDAGGVGLGLAITARILSAHGGRVTVDDGPLGGARFLLELPRTPPRHHRSVTSSLW